MLSLRLAGLAVLLVLTSCAADRAETDSTSPAPDVGCTSYSPTSVHTVAEADLDGSGHAFAIQRVDEGECHLLIGRDGTSPLDTTDLDIAEDAQIGVVQLVGTKRQLLLVPGEQPYLVGEADDVIGVVTGPAGPLLAPMTTGEGASSATAHCNKAGGVDLVSAELSADAGGLAGRYDVTTTSYTLSGNVAAAAAHRTVPSVAEADLRAQDPALFTPGDLFTDCLTP